MEANTVTAPQIVIDLVRRFSDQRSYYLSGKYNETELRRDFLDPFFEALGWDVRNTNNASEKYRDVIHEMSVEVEGQAKSADYLFKIGESPVFFVEAKKPSIKIETDPGPAFQIRRYAWSKKLPVSLLTNFDALAIYDCNARPVAGAAASLGRIDLYRYTDYLAKWEEISAKLSRRAVTGGAYDQYVQGLKGRHGTTDVDDSFLEEMERWRDELAHNIALRNPSITQRELNSAVQTTIDRIIFLRICEDRGIEPEEGLKNATDGIDVYGDILELFRKADKKYNSGLFHFNTEKGRTGYPDTLTPTLKIDDKVFKDILANLYLPKSPYAFKYFSADILGQVYERFLGKVITLSEAHRARVEEKPEVRKAGGVYYTPTYIVNYIVKNTVGELLKDHTPESLAKTPLRVLDPACGSGSFLLGAYQYLMDWYLEWYTANDPAKWCRGNNPALVETLSGWQLTMDKKKEILLNHIYGVDIDIQAVEVTKLSLLLKVVENPGQLSFLSERILPDLGDNIKCGNSLIGPDYYEGQQGKLFDSEEQYRVNAFDWQERFPQVFKNGGFDIVIGNPPYGANFNNLEKKYIRSNYVTYHYKYDSYYYFIERAINNLRKNGLISFITPELWLKLESCYKLRNFIEENTDIDLLLVCGENVFEDAVINTIVFRARRDSHSDFISIQVGDNSWRLESKKWKSRPGKVIDYRVTPEYDDLIQKIVSSNQKPLSDFGEIIQGITPYDRYRGQSDQIIKSRAYHFASKQDETCGKWLSGRDISRYLLTWSGEWLSYGPWLAAPRVSSFFENERILFREVPGKGKRIQAVFVNEPYYHGHSITPFKRYPDNKHSIKYILGISNSKLISWYGGKTLPNFGKEVFPKVNPQDVANIPIRVIDFANLIEKELHDHIVELVRSMSLLMEKFLKSRLPDEKDCVQRQIDATDRQIDNLVYKLYGLTDEEIRIVEESK